jgi:glycosyltransferase involved in cell wall biosynthesis
MLKNKHVSETELPLVTVVTPSLNQGIFIEETIRSVVEQDYLKIEYWIIDGGSTDQSLDVIKRYANRYKFINWISGADSGQSQAINIGFKKAHGEIMAWLNSDDSYCPGAINKAVETFALHPELKMIYGDAFFIDEFGRNTGVFPHTERVFNFKRLVSVSDYISQPTVFLKREVFRGIGYLDESLSWCMDWDFWIRIAQKYPVGYVSFFMANHRDYPLTKTRKGGKKRFDEIVRVIRKHSGKRFPPAYFIYGLGTFLVRFAAFKWIRNLENFFLFHWVINKFIKRFQYIYPDGWVSNEIEFTFFGKKRYFGFSGYIPAGMVPFRFHILVNNRKIQSGDIAGRGKFLFGTGIPRGILLDGRNSIGIVSKKTRRLDTRDRRKVSFKLIDYTFYKKTNEKRSFPKISVITPVSRTCRFLEKAIESVARQKYPFKEHVVVIKGEENDFNRLKTKLCRRYPFVNWVITRETEDSPAINFGIKNAGGDIVSWLDCHDRYEPGAFKLIADFFRKYPGQQFVFTNEDRFKRHVHRTDRVDAGAIDGKYFFRENRICRSSAFWRKEIHQIVGYFSDHLSYRSDLDFWIRSAIYFRLNLVKKRLVKVLDEDQSVGEIDVKDHREILNIVKNHFGTVSWQWALRFGNAYAEYRFKLTGDSFFNKVILNSVAVGVAAAKKILLSRFFPRCQNRTISE